MRFWIPLLLIVMCALSGCQSENPAKASEPGVATFGGPATPAEPAVKPVVKSRLGLIERRRLGITAPNVVRILKEIGTPDELRAMDPSALAVEVAGRLVAEKPAEFKAVAAPDWEAFFEALIAFLEKFIPILIQLIALFG